MICWLYFLIVTPKHKNIPLTEYMHTYVHYSAKYNIQDIEATQFPTMDERIVMFGIYTIPGSYW